MKNKIVISSPELTELVNQVTQLSNKIAEIKTAIFLCEKRRNDANIIMANHNGFQRQSVYDEAQAIYRAEGQEIAQLKRELQPLEIELSAKDKQRRELINSLNACELQRQYEAETIEGNLAEMAKLSKSINDKNIRLIKLNEELAELDKLAKEQTDKQVAHDRYKAEYLAIHEALEEAEAAKAINKSLQNPIGLRSRAAEAKKKYGFCIKQLPTQTLLNSIADKRESLSGEITSIQAEINELQIERYKKGSLIEQIKFNSKLDAMLQHLPRMAAYDDLTSGKSQVALNLIEHLKTKGITKLTGNGLSFSSAVLKGLLDNLDEVKAQIMDELEAELTL